MREPIVYRLKRSTSSGNFIGKTGEHCGPRCILPEVDADEVVVTIVQLPSVRERRAEVLKRYGFDIGALSELEKTATKEILDALESIDRGEP